MDREAVRDLRSLAQTKIAKCAQKLSILEVQIQFYEAELSSKERELNIVRNLPDLALSGEIVYRILFQRTGITVQLEEVKQQRDVENNEQDLWTKVLQQAPTL